MTTETLLPPRDEVAQTLAHANFELGPGVIRIFRIVGPAEDGSEEPIKLLVVNESTVAVGIMPLYFSKKGRICYPSAIVEITPEEYDRLARNELALPDGWHIAQEYQRPQP